jgi:AcrR family transcriptional regulator
MSADATAERRTARERILSAAYDLYSTRGIRDVGVDEVIEQAGVAKATLYRRFSSKDELVIAFLDLREQRWVADWVVAEATRRADTAEGRLLAIFDLFDEWFHRDDFEGCSFINALLEMGPDHPIGQASQQQLKAIRTILSDLAQQANLRDPETFARSWHILMKGSIVSAAEGDLDAARLARATAQLVLEHHAPQLLADRVPTSRPARR